MPESKTKNVTVPGDTGVKHVSPASGKSKSEIAVLIICAVITASATITAAFFATRKQTTIEVRNVPTIGLDDFQRYFPLQLGNEWIYEGSVRKTMKDDSVTERKVEVHMKVMEVITTKNAAVKLFILRGHPADALSEETSPSNYAYLMIGNKIFEIDDVESVKQFVQSGGFSDAFKLTEDQLVFELPFFKGQRFGDTGSMARADMGYLWYVNDVRQYDAPDDNKIIHLVEYEIMRNNLSDTESVLFRPYLGIVEFSYVHHGTINEVHVSLKDYHLNSQ